MDKLSAYRINSDLRFNFENKQFMFSKEKNFRYFDNLMKKK